MTYESYELDLEWAQWLSQNYRIISRPTPGDRLVVSPPKSADLIHTNGVFVYTPFLVTIKYIGEMIRVARHGGYVAFDIFSERCVMGERMKTWLTPNYVYPCIMPRELVM